MKNSISTQTKNWLVLVAGLIFIHQNVHSQNQYYSGVLSSGMNVKQYTSDGGYFGSQMYCEADTSLKFEETVSFGEVTLFPSTSIVFVSSQLLSDSHVVDSAHFIYHFPNIDVLGATVSSDISITEVNVDPVLHQVEFKTGTLLSVNSGWLNAFRKFHFSFENIDPTLDSVIVERTMQNVYVRDTTNQQLITYSTLPNSVTNFVCDCNSESFSPTSLSEDLDFNVVFDGNNTGPLLSPGNQVSLVIESDQYCNTPFKTQFSLDGTSFTDLQSFIQSIPAYAFSAGQITFLYSHDMVIPANNGYLELRLINLDDNSVLKTWNTGSVGITENQLNENLTVYPIPLRKGDKLVIENPYLEDNQWTEISIYNMLGQNVFSSEVKSEDGKIELATDELFYNQEGQYILKLELNGSILTKKLIFQP